MKLSERDSILKALYDNASFSEKDGLNFQEIKSIVGEFNSGRMTEAKNAGLVKSNGNRSMFVYWLTAEGVSVAEKLNSAAQCTEEQQCPAAVGGDIDPDLEIFETTLPQCNSIIAPSYNPKDVAFSNHTDAYNIVQANDCQIPKEIVEFFVIDKDGNPACSSFELKTDAINHAHFLAATGSEHSVEQVITRRIGTAKPITTTQWVAA